MAFFAHMFLPLTISVGLATIVSAVWWQRLESPWAYLGLSFSLASQPGSLSNNPPILSACSISQRGASQ